MKRNAVLVVIFVLAAILTWPIYAKVRQARRNSIYAAELTRFQRDLHIGVSREEVNQYLDARHVNYCFRPGSGNGPEYQIEIGEEDTLICEWHVYIALEFSLADTLKVVHLKKEGTCL